MTRSLSKSVKVECSEKRKQKVQDESGNNEDPVVAESLVTRLLVSVRVVEGKLIFSNEDDDFAKVKVPSVVLFKRGGAEEKKWGVGVVQNMGAGGVTVNMLMKTGGVACEKEEVEVTNEDVKLRVLEAAAGGSDPDCRGRGCQ